MFEHAGPDAVREWEQLASRVQDALVAAAIPVTATHDPQYRAGAEIEVDSGDDEAGGVYVTWWPHLVLVKEVTELARQRNFEDPVVEHRSRVAEVMRNAIGAVLESAGFSVSVDDIDERPSSVKVHA